MMKVEMKVDGIVNLLELAIFRALLPPGNRLGADKVARGCGLTKNSTGKVREAFQQLRGRGIVVAERSGKSTHVRDFSYEQACRVFDARAVVETGVVHVIAERASEQDPEVMQALEQLQVHITREQEVAEQTKADQKSSEELIEVAGDFHNMLANVTGNDDLIQTVRNLVGLSSMLLTVFPSPSVYDEAGHLAILRLLREAKGGAARVAISKHLEGLAKSLNRTTMEKTKFIEVNPEEVLRALRETIG